MWMTSPARTVSIATVISCKNRRMSLNAREPTLTITNPSGIFETGCWCGDAAIRSEKDLELRCSEPKQLPVFDAFPTSLFDRPHVVLRKLSREQLWEVFGNQYPSHAAR